MTKNVSHVVDVRNMMENPLYEAVIYDEVDTSLPVDVCIRSLSPPEVPPPRKESSCSVKHCIRALPMNEGFCGDNNHGTSSPPLVQSPTTPRYTETPTRTVTDEHCLFAM